MYLDSKDFQTVWNLAHSWTGHDPDTTDPNSLPQDVKDTIHRMVASILRGDLPARTKRFAIFIDESFFTLVFDFAHFIRIYKCLNKDVFKKAYGKRIMGYDNAHAVKLPKKFKYAGQRLTYDHKHRHASDKGVPYEFKDAAQLLEDFFAEVDRVIEELKR